VRWADIGLMALYAATCFATVKTPQARPINNMAPDCMFKARTPPICDLPNLEGDAASIQPTADSAPESLARHYCSIAQASNHSDASSPINHV
jgi:hypothetical protein